MWISAVVRGRERAILVPLPEDVLRKQTSSFFVSVEIINSL
ncbi:MAG: hypothetical protein QG640_380 [Patescibacteria group bacterium]|nr:hypothetical protein [Patescibacteria group bacterium]